MNTEQPGDVVTQRLLGAFLIRGLRRNQGAALLADCGMATRDIALVYGTTDASIRTAIRRGRDEGRRNEGVGEEE